MKKCRKWIERIILIFAVCVFCFSAFQLYKIFSQNHAEKREVEEVRELVKVPDKENNLEKFRVDFEQLAAINPDIVGWIVVQDTDISYPVVKGKDNDYYLTHTFQKNTNYAGAVFMDYRADGALNDMNTFIYAHNLYNGTLFAELENYMKKDFFNEHPYVYYYSPNGNYKLQVFSAYVDKDTSNSYKMQFASVDEFASYLQLIKSKSRYQTNMEVSAQDRIVTLYTCSYESGANPENTETRYIDDRYYVHAKVVKDLGTE